MKPLRVSVVIPAYNEEKLISRCISSLENQRVAPYEIIVVDNNSSDRTASIAQSHGVVVIKEKRQGIAWARNAGFDAAKGDIIARLDADCIAPKHWIERITEFYSQNPAQSYAVTGMGYYATSSLAVGKILGTVIIGNYNIGNRLMLGHPGLFGSCMAFPAAWWESVRGEVCCDSDAIHEDVDLSVHLLRMGYSIKKLKNFYTYIDSRTLQEPLKKTIWRFKIWPRSAYRHRKLFRSTAR